MPARVDHIVNFDFPHSPVDYIHRAGRTARAGVTGKVTSLLQKRDLVLGDRIEDALRHERPLDDLSADRKQLPSIMRYIRCSSVLLEALSLSLASDSKLRLRFLFTGKAKMRVRIFILGLHLSVEQHEQ